VPASQRLDRELPPGGKSLPQTPTICIGKNQTSFTGAQIPSWHRLCITKCRHKPESTTMDIQPFAQHEQALKFRALRNLVLTSNIANADTPNYKARDVEFSDVLKDASSGSLPMKKTSELHRDAWSTSRMNPTMKYRVPMQPTLDGNTVETDVEQAAFAENAVQYRASLAFLNGQIRTLRYALKGTD
jgi:flagellar basal-body rod protein FlgB